MPTEPKLFGTGNTAAGALDGTETLSVVRSGALVDTTTQAIADLGGGGGGAPVDLIVALGDETTAITTGAAKVTIRAPRAITLSKIKASLSTAGSGSSAFDVNKNGVSLFSTPLTIDASEKTSETAATAAVLATTAIAADDEITFDIDTAGASAAGAKITLVGVAA